MCCVTDSSGSGRSPLTSQEDHDGVVRPGRDRGCQVDRRSAADCHQSAGDGQEHDGRRHYEGSLSQL